MKTTTQSNRTKLVDWGSEPPFSTAEAWFAFGERVAYDPTIKRINLPERPENEQLFVFYRVSGVTGKQPEALAEIILEVTGQS